MEVAMAEGEVSASLLNEEPRANAELQHLEWRVLHDALIAPGSAPLTIEEQDRLWSLTAELLAFLGEALNLKEGLPAKASPGPSDPLFFAASAIMEAIGGSPPEAWRPRKGRRKGQAKTGMERVGIGFASAYLKAVDIGLFSDPKHTQTVRRLYGVNGKTVQGWAKLPCDLQWKALQESLNDLDESEGDLPPLRQQKAERFLRRGAHFYKRRVL
jgi:hypothetical protein